MSMSVSGDLAPAEAADDDLIRRITTIVRETIAPDRPSDPRGTKRKGEEPVLATKRFVSCELRVCGIFICDLRNGGFFPQFQGAI
jgi:hypothetical protein